MVDYPAARLNELNKLNEYWIQATTQILGGVFPKVAYSGAPACLSGCESAKAGNSLQLAKMRCASA
jgi:hypothetical protein